MPKRHYLLLGVAMFIASFASQLAEAKGVTNVQKFKNNGFQFFLAEDHSIPNVLVGLTFETGASSDPEELDGLSQFTMDMLMRGTKTRSRQQVIDQVEQLGATLSPTVGFHHMSLVGETLTRYLDKFFTIAADVLMNPAFLDAELKDLKKETIDLLRLSLNNDASVGRRHFYELIFGKHPYGRQVDGTLKSIEALTIDHLKKRYQEFLKKGHLTVYAAGDIEKEKLIALTEKYFNDIPDGALEGKKIGVTNPLKNRHLVVVDKPDRTQIQLFMGHASIEANDADYFPLEVTNTSFGGFFNSRYAQEIRIKRGWTYHAGSYLSLNRDAGTFGLRTFTAEKNLGDVVKKSLEMLAELSEKGLSKEELDKAKSSLVNEFPFKIDTADKRVQQQLRIQYHKLPDNFLDTYQS